MPKKNMNYDEYSAKKDQEFLEDLLKTAFKKYEKNKDIDQLLEQLGQAASIKGMTDIADETDISRQHLYTMLSAGSNPSFSNMEAVLNALGYQMRFKKLK